MKVILKVNTNKYFETIYVNLKQEYGGNIFYLYANGKWEGDMGILQHTEDIFYALGLPSKKIEDITPMFIDKLVKKLTQLKSTKDVEFHHVEIVIPQQMESDYKLFKKIGEKKYFRYKTLLQDI